MKDKDAKPAPSQGGADGGSTRSIDKGVIDALLEASKDKEQEKFQQGQTNSIDRSVLDDLLRQKEAQRAAQPSALVLKKAPKNAAPAPAAPETLSQEWSEFELEEIHPSPKAEPPSQEDDAPEDIEAAISPGLDDERAAAAPAAEASLFDDVEGLPAPVVERTPEPVLHDDEAEDGEDGEDVEDDAALEAASQDEEVHVEQPKKQAPVKAQPAPSIDYDEDDDDLVPPKRSSTPILIGIVILLVVVLIAVVLGLK